MLLLMVIVIVILILLTFLVPSQKGYSEIENLQRYFHEYSGVNPELYLSFYNNLELMKNNIEDVHLASKYLYQAIDNIEDLFFYIPEYENPELVNELALKGEDIIFREALRTGESFRPRYLNNKVL